MQTSGQYLSDPTQVYASSGVSPKSTTDTSVYDKVQDVKQLLVITVTVTDTGMLGEKLQQMRTQTKLTIMGFKLGRYTREFSLSDISYYCQDDTQKLLGGV